MPTSRNRGPATQPGSRRANAERTRDEILAVARQEFAEHGLSGGRIDAIAARTRTTKRMIYYYFSSKEGLYQAVLEQAYGDIRNIELELDLDSLGPVDAIRRMISFTFDHQQAHPDFIRLVSIENIHNGEYLARSDKLRAQNMTVIRTLTRLLTRGQRSGVFRSDINATDLHLMISALCFYRVSNRHTFGRLFDCDLAAPRVRARHKRLITDAIVRMLEPRGTKPRAVGTTGRTPQRSPGRPVSRR